MAPDDECDWRVTEGPAFGLEPDLVLSDIRLNAHFHVTGAMGREAWARLATDAPLVIDSTGRTLAELPGEIRIFDSLPQRSYPGLYPGHFDSIALCGHRGALALPGGDWFAVHLYLPPEQFDALLPVIVPGGTADLRIEVDRTLDQGLLDDQRLFWNDRISPVVLFNEFSIWGPARSG